MQTSSGDRKTIVPTGNNDRATVSDLGLTGKAIHEARQLRDAEAADPGAIRRTSDDRPERGQEPAKAACRCATQPLARRISPCV